MGELNTMAKVYYTADEVADELRVSQRTLYRYIKDGRLQGKKAEGGRKWLFTRADIDGMKAHKTDPQNQPTKDTHTGLVKVRLTKDEEELLKLLRTLDDQEQEEVLKFVRGEITEEELQAYVDRRKKRNA